MTHSFPPRRSSDLGEPVLAQQVLDREPERRLVPRLLQVMVQVGAVDRRHDGVEAGLSGQEDLGRRRRAAVDDLRSEEHTSELQSLMRISYAVFCLKKKKNNNRTSKNISNKT